MFAQGYKLKLVEETENENQSENPDADQFPKTQIP